MSSLPLSRLTFDAIAERADMAGAYARIAAEAATVGDRRAVAYGLRCAAIALASAADAAQTLRPTDQGGGR